ncbi:hypothetical protein AB0D49_33510 [Streptomyces sp. NPDC048290]
MEEGVRTTDRPGTATLRPAGRDLVAEAVPVRGYPLKRDASVGT